MKFTEMITLSGLRQILGNQLLIQLNSTEAMNKILAFDDSLREIGFDSRERYTVLIRLAIMAVYNQNRLLSDMILFHISMKISQDGEAAWVDWLDLDMPECGCKGNSLVVVRDLFWKKYEVYTLTTDMKSYFETFVAKIV